MIVKLQRGGGMPPFTYYRPVSITLPSGTVAQPATASSGKSSELSNADLLKTLDKIDGLPSDMTELKSGLISALGGDGSLFGSDSSSMFSSTNQLATQYANTILGIKIANFSKKRYDDIKKGLDSNGGLNEVAVTSSGGVMVTDKDGKITQVSVDTYLQNKGQYKALTNSNILYMRAYDTTYANNDALMDIASNGIGMTEINKQIKAALGQLGSSETNRESYAVLQGAEVLKSIYEKTGELKLEGLYKMTNISQNQKEQAQAALNYIWGILPDNAKAVLKIKAGSSKGAIELIGQLVASGTTDKSTHKESYVLDADGNKPGSNKGGGSDGKYKPGVVSNFIRGNGKESTFTIMNGTNDGIQVHGVTSTLTNNSGKVGGPMSLLTASKGGFSGVLDWQNVSVGGVHVSDAHLSEIMCTDGQIHSVDFPIDMNEYAKGNIIPDYKMFAAKEAADNEIKSGKITDYEQINEIYRKHNLPIKYNSDGSLKTEYWARFGVMNGVALSKAFDEDQSFNDTLREVGDSELESYLKLYNNEAHISGSGQELKGQDIEFDKSSWWDKMWGNGQHWWSTHDQMFKGTIFIPIKADEMAAMAGDNSHAYIGENEAIAGLQQDHDLQESFNEQGLLDE